MNPKARTKAIKEILAGLDAGLTLKLASENAGFDLSVITLWLRSDDQFASKIQRAIAGNAKKQVAKILKSDDWRAAAWYLERTQRDEFGAQSKVDVTVTSAEEARRELALLINPRALDNDDPNETT